MTSPAFDASLEVDPNGQITFEWHARRGYHYAVESSEDLITWHPVGAFYGFGADIALPVYQIPAGSGAGGPPLGPSETKSAFFMLRYFDNVGKTLVSWTEPGSEDPVLVVIPYDYSDVGDLPVFSENFDDLPNDVRYALAFSVWEGVWDASLDTHTVASLTTEQQERLSWFTDRESDVHAAMLAATAPNGPVGVAPVSGTGSSTTFRCEESAVDSDGDGLLDHHEWKFGSDPFLVDSDFDGFGDYTEVIQQTLPTDPTSTPGGGGGSTTPPDPEADDDGDGIPNGDDFDPLDRNIDWPKTALPAYAVVRIPGASGMSLRAVNNKGVVLLYGQDSDPDQTWKPFTWNPGDSQPTAVHLGNVTTEAWFPETNADGEIELVRHEADLCSAEGFDIDDSGVIVGEGRFDDCDGSGPTSGTFANTIALRWASATATPELVHPGSKRLSEEKGDLLLLSSARSINNQGYSIGVAEFHYIDDSGAMPVDANALVDTRWSPGAAEDPGTPIYTPTVDTEIHGQKPDLSILRLANVQGSLVTGSFENTPALWQSWRTRPDFTFSGGGTAAGDLHLMPNSRFAVLTDRRLMLRNEGRWEPSLRIIEHGEFLTADGTIWKTDNTLFHASESHEFADVFGRQNYAITDVVDVSRDGYAIADTDQGPVLILPLQFEWVKHGQNDDVSDHTDPFTGVKCGQRVFPGAHEPGASVRKTVKLKVSRGAEGLTLNARAFDIDDATDPAFDSFNGSPVIDVNDTGGEEIGDDNFEDDFETPLTGEFVDTAGPSATADFNGSGVADLDFCVGMQPGNNYRVAIAVDPNIDLDDVQVTTPSATGYLANDVSHPDGIAVVGSPPLTVWRRLHVENDSMGAIPAVRPSPNRIEESIIAINPPSTIVATANSNPSSDDFFYNLGYVSKAGIHAVVVESRSGSLLELDLAPDDLASFAVGDAITVYDDDDKGLPDAYTIGHPSDELWPRLNLPRNNLVTPWVIERFRPAFVEVVDASDLDLNPNTEVPFESNINDSPTGLGLESVVDDAQDLEDSAEFWCQLLVTSYQGPAYDDDDPRGGVYGPQEGVNFAENLGSYRSFAALVFLEVVRERWTHFVEVPQPQFDKRIDQITAHEVGHSPAQPSDSGISNDHHEEGLMGEGAPEDEFSALTVRRFRLATEGWTR